MTQDEIIEITRKLEICELTSKPKQDIHYSLTIHEMQTFAKLVAAKALAHPEQEPVGEVVNATDKAFECKFVKILPIGTKFYTTPPQRTWVGLTDEEVRKICVNEWGGYEQCRAIEAKLMEKNT